MKNIGLAKFLRIQDINTGNLQIIKVKTTVKIPLELEKQKKKKGNSDQFKEKLIKWKRSRT